MFIFKRINRMIIVLLLVVVCVFLSGCKQVEFDYENGELVVGMECDYAPFNWTETVKTDSNVEIYQQKGLYADGYDVQMARLISEELNLKLVIKKIVFSGLIQALNSGDIDVIIAGMSPTQDRKYSINFTNEYYESEHVVIVSVDGKYANATKFSDFSGSNVVGQKGTSYEALATQLANKANAKNNPPLETVPLIISGIILGDNDVTVVEKPVAISVCYTNPSLKWIKLEDNFEVNEEERIVSIGVRKNDDQLLNDLNLALSKISKDTRDELMNKASSDLNE